MSTAAIILAAGLSRRMGRFKPLLAVGGRTVIERAVFTFRAAGIHDVRVVTGHSREELEPLLEGIGIRPVHNPGFEAGMFSSVTVGLSNLGNEVTSAFILPGDMPLVSPSTVAALLSRHGEEPDRILVPCFEGRRGHPVMIPASLFTAIRSWSGEDGLKGAIDGQRLKKADVPVRDPGILFDLDTPEDLEAALRRFALTPAPGETEPGRCTESREGAMGQRGMKEVCGA